MTVAVPIMHEQVHQRTGQSDEVREQAEHVRRVLGEEVEAPDPDGDQRTAEGAAWRATSNCCCGCGFA